MAKLRIAYIAYWPNSIYDALFKHLQEHDIQVRAFIGDEFSTEKNFYVKTPSKRLWSWTRFRMPWVPHIRRLESVEDFLESQKPDVIIANMWYQPDTALAMRYAREHNIPFVLQTEIQRWPKHWLVRLVARCQLWWFDRHTKRLPLAIAWTESSKQFVSKHFRVDRVTSVLPGVDTKRFKPRTGKKGTQLLMVARFLPYKRHRDVIEAMRILVHERGEKLTLSLLGAYGDHTELETLIEKKKLSDHITILDPVPFEQMPSVYRAHDALVLASFNEAIGIVLSEALASGLPVVCSDTVGGQDYVDEDCGVLYPTGDVNKLADAIQEVLSWPVGVRKKVRARALEFTHEKQAEKYAEKLRLVLK